MKTLIAYTTKYGATKACAEQIAERLHGDVQLVALTKDTAVDLAPFDAVIIGTPIYIGKPRKACTMFIKQHQEVLLTKKLGLYLCCMQDESQSVAQSFQVAFPKELRDHAAVQAVLGGMMDRSKLGKLDAFIMRIVTANLKGSQMPLSTISQERIDQLVTLMND